MTRAVHKYTVSAFVACTFAAYAFHVRLSSPGGGLSVATANQPEQNPVTLQLAEASPALTDAASVAAPTDEPSPVPLPTARPSPTLARGQYRDGQYAGSVADAYYGYVQVQATVRQGRLSDIQMIQYPNDRRTSVRINNVAIPYLTSEALQAQSANVDIISGATLTSDAFAESLQSALRSAEA